MRLTQQGLQASAALRQPLVRVTLWEEHRRRDPIGCRLKAEAHRHEQIFPATDMAHFILDAFLCGVHSILLSTVDPLQGLLNLCTQLSFIRLKNLTLLMLSRHVNVNHSSLNSTHVHKPGHLL